MEYQVMNTVVCSEITAWYYSFLPWPVNNDPRIKCIYLSPITACLRCSCTHTARCQRWKQNTKRVMNLPVPKLCFELGLAKCLWLKSMTGRYRAPSDGPITGRKTSRATWAEVGLKPCSILTTTDWQLSRKDGRQWATISTAQWW